MTHGQNGAKLKELLGLAREPVALGWMTKPPDGVAKLEKKERFCAKLDRAGLGECFYATADEEDCQGGVKYCGLGASGELAAPRRSGSFLVAWGIYKSVAAVQRAWRGYERIEPGIFEALAFAPLSEAPFEPDVIVVRADAKQGMELLHANAFDSGARALGADSAPICSSMAAVPYLTGRVTYGFGDVGSREHMRLGADEVLVSIPGCDLARIVSNLEQMRSKKSFRV